MAQGSSRRRIRYPRTARKAYAEGITSGAPNAVQIAERFHIVMNLCEALELLLTRHHGAIRQAANPIEVIRHPTRNEHTSIPVTVSQNSETTSQRKMLAIVAARRTKHLAQYQEMIELKEQGIPVKQIAQRIGKSVVTVGILQKTRFAANTLVSSF